MRHGGKVNWTKDIVDAIAAFRVAFLQANMKPPEVILLADHREGMYLLSYLRDSCNWTATTDSGMLGKPVEMADGSVYMEIELMGMKVRWPANHYATKDGTWFA